jgi:hypothetical protein
MEFTRALALQLVSKTFNAADVIQATSPTSVRERNIESTRSKVGPSGYRFIPKSTQSAGNSIKEEIWRRKQEELRRKAARLGPEFVYELHDRDQKRAQVAVQILKFAPWDVVECVSGECRKIGLCLTIKKPEPCLALPGQDWSVSFEYFPALAKACKKNPNFAIGLLTLVFKVPKPTNLACQGRARLWLFFSKPEPDFLAFSWNALW